MPSKTSTLTRLIGTLAPNWAANRARAEAKEAMWRAVRMQYDAADVGRRTYGWRTVSTDANEVSLSTRARLRDYARDMVRNNAHAERAKSLIAHNVVGHGIIPTLVGDEALTKRIEPVLLNHYDTTKVDVEGRHDVYGLQNLVMKGVVEAGEMLVRRRRRLRSDGLPLAFQLQVMEPDYLDTSINGTQRDGTIAVQGIGYSPFGKIENYWLFDQHPGSNIFYSGSRLTSRPVPAADVAHVFRTDRAGQVRGITWFAPVMLKMRDLADFEDAHLMRQKIAACFAAFITTEQGFTIDPTAPDAPSDGSSHKYEALEPGMIQRLEPGESVTFGAPPTVLDFDPYVKANLRQIAAGLGVSYEALTGDLTGVNFSSGRLGWLEFQRSIDAWRDFMLVPQLCTKLADWFFEAAAIEVGFRPGTVAMKWTPPRREMISPDQEVPAIRNAIRAGLTSRSEEQRKLGFDPKALDEEIAQDNMRADDKGLVFDSDARVTTQQGLAQIVPKDPNATTTDPGATSNGQA